jgi:adenylate kinase
MLAEAGTRLDAAIMLDAATDTIIERLSGRRVCRRCRASWHVRHKPPRVEGVCDACGGSLFQRDDDRLESIQVRLAAYRETSGPVVDFYRVRGLLRVIDASAPPDAVFALVQAALVGGASVEA